jgi:hypothetical protein
MGMFIDQRFRQKVVLIVAAVFVVASLSGCTTLRRKFVRKSKTEDTSNQVIPILQPEEYKPAVHTPMDEYRLNYSILQGYWNDLMDALSWGGNDKRETYLIAQIVAKMDAMADLLKDEKQSEMRNLSSKMSAAMVELDKPRMMRRYDVLQLNAESVRNSVHRDFKPDTIAPFFK